MSDGRFSLTVTQREGFQFDIQFDEPSWAPLTIDEPPPLGEGTAPNPSRILAASVGSCLAASLLFCLQKSRVPVSGVKATVDATMARNEDGRLRIGSIDVNIEPGTEGVPSKRFERCLDLFEDFCVVTQSVREGIDVNVTVDVPEDRTEDGDDLTGPEK